MVLGLFLGEYSKDSAAAAGLLVLAGLLAAAALDEAGLALAGTFRRLLLLPSQHETSANFSGTVAAAWSSSSDGKRSRALGLVAGLTPTGSVSVQVDIVSERVAAIVDRCMILHSAVRSRNRRRRW